MQRRPATESGRLRQARRSAHHLGGMMALAGNALWFIAALACCSMLVGARSGEAQPRTILIKAIDIKGNKRVEESTIRFYIQSRVAEAFSVSKLRQDVRRIYQLDFFDDVQVDAEEFEGGLKITFIVFERPSVRTVTFTGNKKIESSLLREKVGFKVPSILTRHLIQEAIAKLKAIYEEKGYYLAEVKSVTKQLEADQLGIEFHIDEGEKLRIVRIGFTGNHHFTDQALRRVMETKPKGLFSFITGSGIYKRDAIGQDLERLQGFYRDHGYVQVQVEEPRIEVRREQRQILLTIPLVEGEQFTTGKLEVAGDEVYSAETLRGLMRLKSGEVFNRSLLQQDVLKVTDLYVEKGYAFVDVAPLTSVDEARRTVDVSIRVNRGRRIYVGRIQISGNTKTRDKVIRREMRLREGELFSSNALRRSRQRLGNLGFFQEVKLDQRGGTEEDLLDIDVKVEERPTAALSAGAGFSSLDQFTGVFGISQSNLFGRGQAINLNTQLGTRVTNFDLIFTEPWFLDRPLSLGVDAFSTRRVFINYAESDRGGALRLGRAFGEFNSASLRYRLASVEIFSVEENASRFIQEQAGARLTSTLTPTFVRDTRDNVFDPTTGFRHSLSVDFAGGPLGGSIDLYRIIQESSTHIPVWRGLVLSLRDRAGFERGLGGGDLPIFERFFMGGVVNQVRGFRRRDIGPKDENGDEVGGLSSFLFSTELRIPLVPTLKGVIFFDAGNVFAREEAFDLTAPLRRGVGVGMRFFSPLGPVRLDWGYKLDRKSGEPATDLSFTLGTFF